MAVARPGCLSKMTARKGLPVEYREIRYTVRARIERNKWTVSIHPGGIEGARRVVTGPRERAELLARSMINRWYERAPRAQRGAVNLYNREARPSRRTSPSCWSWWVAKEAIRPPTEAVSAIPLTMSPFQGNGCTLVMTNEGPCFATERSISC